MEMRELRPGDAARCAELEKILFPDENPWSENVFMVEFAHPHTFYLGAFEQDGDAEGQLLGYAGMAMLGPRDDPEFEIHTIGVDPGHQRRGIARLLMDNLMLVADNFDAQVFLEVRTDNEPAIAMYERYGFTNQGIRRNYYQPSGADAYTMSRPSRSER
ncbi:ribosomal-protein-alanine N-acetyltransferase [Corynebacterium occultum]|uniref:Ribosomal-protein-alanine N-acetyltransferase n=1 Tax=Corynebacterium occultum TaxID=2675219 RepID=A0A6B8W908_9CORY|nr:ribosomal protein S18-alanine N-acetyltransferase [Corynebacterium occultum]QGU06490.1 ribosomal-protein-alanine N-acetyltransferase [Corynebacterium occultum]